MKKCDGCGKEFDDSIELFPRLIVSKEAQIARKLAERGGKDMLCLPCWLESMQSVDNKDLASLLLMLLRRNQELERERRPFSLPVQPDPSSYPPVNPWTITPYRQVTIDKTWVSDRIYPEVIYTAGWSVCSETH
jgi:hypothetical protein